VSAADHKPLAAALLAEFLGTAGLLCAVIGSGVMAETLSGGNDGVALSANTLATVFALFVLIEVFGPISGAHFNPAVTLALAAKGMFKPPQKSAIAFYIVAQLAGGAAGAWTAHAMFGLDILQLSSKARGGWGQLLGELVATAGLMLVILRAPVGKGSALVACYIGAAYWFTSSTSFANPAAVAGRMLSDTFAGIAPANAPAFVAAQLAGAACGCAAAWALDRLSREV
jgi:glycerol uptake facilitator-like aquaporin